MLFNTFQFLIFYTFMFSVYFALPHRRRWILLLIGSIYFYMAYKPINILLLALTLVVDYFAGLGLLKYKSSSARTVIVLCSLTTNIGILFIFKYCGFVMESMNTLFAALGVDIKLDPIHLSLPVGISFYTFQSMSYVLDVLGGRLKPERNPFTYATYVSFFPQLVAGPIERAAHLLPQFHREHYLQFDRISSGLQWSLWGMFKKVVIADSFSAVVTTVYSDPDNYSGLALFVATLFFAIQIYCDFSGYSDIAIGVARMLGFDLMINFRQPYLARSIADFWQRWHISLTTWFRDYLYIPLGGNRVGLTRWALNVSLVFLISGLWHGANVTFIIWGALHALYFLIGRFTEWPRAHAVTLLRLRWIPGLMPTIEWTVTMLLVLIGWVFFRAANVQEAWYITTHMFDFRGANLNQLYNLGLPRFEMMLAFVWIPFMMAVDYCLAFHPAWSDRLWKHRLFRHLCYQVLFFGIALFGVFEKVEFIYFAF